MSRHVAATVAVALLFLGAALKADSSASEAAATPTVAQMVGQRMLVAFHGTTPDQALLARIKAGQIGGVILSSGNIRDATQLTTLTGKLQAAARAGGQPPLLVAADQEGGLVRRVPWAPPKASAEELGTTTATHVETVGRNTGVALRDVGVNLDLAPVADVPRTRSNFIEAEHRAFAFNNRYTVAKDAAAFAEGLEAGGVLPTLKHFPGLGRAGATSTDDGLVRITASREQIGYDLLPYRVALAKSLSPVVMLSTAVYPAYSPKAAAWSSAIARTLLRHDLGFRGVTITDSLTAAAAVRGTTPGVLAIRSAKVGVDLLLVTGSESTSQAAYQAVLREARSGAIPLANLQASYARIVELKSRI
ncbi:MAG TPA: glycoside hydrolase family 3 N-terminal domain-containing protein [Gaiellaceae bacterium]